MMHIKHLKERLKRQQQKSFDFYTPSGIHVYFKDPIEGNVDIEAVVAKIESKIPLHLLSGIEMIIVGWFEEFDERSVNAFYDSGTVYVSNVQDNNEDIYDDIVHELAHSLEESHGYLIYGDNKIRNEFLQKRSYLHNMLWNMGFKAPKAFFRDTEYNKEFDDFLFKKVGYMKLSPIVQGVFISPYAPTSIREYFATLFTEFYLDSDHGYIKKLSPELYEKILILQDPENLDY